MSFDQVCRNIENSRSMKMFHQGKHSGEDNGGRLDSGRLDSGVCESFQSRTDSFGSTGSRTNSVLSDYSRTSSLPKEISSLSVQSISSFDSGIGSLDSNGPSHTSSLHKDLEKLRIDETLTEEEPCIEIITLAQLKARSKEQKLKDLESYDFASAEDERCDSGVCEISRCSSLIEEEQRPPHFQQDIDGDTFCHLAIVHQQIEAANQVIETCPSWRLLNIQNELGQSPLHLATLTNQPHMVRKLLCHGAAVDLRDRKGNTPLHLACKEGFFDCVVALTRRVTHEETQQVGYSVPFQRIPQAPEQQNYEGHTCIQLAASGSHYPILNHLVIECRANINEADWKSGRTLLHRAVEANNTSLVEFLLTHPRIDLDKKTYEGYTALQLAMGRRFMDIIQLLMLAGAEDCPSPHSNSSSGSDDDDEEEDMNCKSESECDDGYDDFIYQGQAITLHR